MLNSCCRWILIVALVGCGSTMDDPPPPPGDDAPDAEPESHEPVCAGDSCGLPSDGPCCEGTTCVDWALAGPVECAVECETDTDCPDGGCCDELSNGHHACGPAGTCDAGGVVPEYLCNELDECGQIGSYNQCLLSITSCVDNLTDEQEREWLTDMSECGGAGDDGTCDSYYTYCWANYVPWC